jgi:glycosyltransferase involved in cell wall biosynthesis
VLINHGIAFDLPIEYLTRKSILKHRRLEIIKRISHFKHALERFERCRNRVCVDYNQLNWYRTWRSVDETSRIWVIPNSAPRLTELELKSRHRGQGQAIRILFARRFEPFRGTRLMASIVATLLLRFPEVQFTFAGDGSDAEWLHSRFKNNPRVTIKKVPYSERIALHLEHDIAVVPSFGSEGTSLSVVEAMASGCAVVATNVGGVPNIVIDGYNGLLVDTRESDVEAALIRLITNETYRNAIRERAGEMANDAFSLDIWKQRWVGVLNTLAASPA